MAAKTETRARLIHAAEKMTYRRGFRQMTLADIAREARVPLGNVYYYFKTKDDIGAAIVDRLHAQVLAQLEAFDAAGSPQDRLCAAVDAVLANKVVLAQGGCPVGSLCSELHKEGGVLADAATLLFEEQLQWLEAQFKACGQKREARRLAVHVLSALQGVSTLAHSLHDPQVVVGETAALKKWIRSL